jgi:hypothetical protein
MGLRLAAGAVVVVSVARAGCGEGQKTVDDDRLPKCSAFTVQTQSTMTLPLGPTGIIRGDLGCKP